MRAVLLLTALAVGAPALKEKPKAESDIVGLWAVESMRLGGKGPLEVPAGLQYEFTADGQWIGLRDGNGGLDGKSPPAKGYKVEVKGEQRMIDTTGPSADRPGMAGIYKVDGDTLTICFGSPGADRPTEFTSPEGGRVMHMVLKRVAKKK
jgi:uncharacterized protein (TIGR03067 family)